MPWSHHSHSGQFCGHAANTLEQVVQTAIAKGMTTFCMTEHMPREIIDFYPEEQDHHTEASLAELYDAFYHEARRLQKAYADQIELFVGFEGEWIRPSSYTLIQNLLEKYPVDLFVGSVHHTVCHPIDFDHAMYHAARDQIRTLDINAETKHETDLDVGIFAQYFDDQFEMLQALQPPVIGHFDLIRLKSDDPDGSFRRWSTIWAKIERNLDYIASYGGVLELNSSSLRKGMREAYPQVEICKAFLERGGRFTLSDDSHGVAQVGLNYGRVLDCVEQAGISQLHRLTRQEPGDKEEPVFNRFPGMTWKAFNVTDLKQHEFFVKLARA